ncbi:hypothetical protein [Rhizobium rhizogenes]|uniref:hypothetical protein n=1 Tax=Rhizobium rhizogenes TaxID=359 RepID=UPI00157223C9|nr:hypothetical protein [Rhizobium rhizogenes]NTI39529.1 hypothetical protein [Rhizobium rhizogenes]WEO67930.1 hypothetical protein G6L54_029835 [Rhizobium rhizogenes]
MIAVIAFRGIAGEPDIGRAATIQFPSLKSVADSQNHVTATPDVDRYGVVASVDE